jgi:6-phosphogluconolactonase (cycloisomerase 2 family)
VQVFERQANGTLADDGAPVPTGGIGSGSAGGQGSVTLSSDGRTLLVVNEGTGSVTTSSVSDFAVGPNGGLTLRNTVPSGGLNPISVAISGNLVEVLNAGSATVPGSVVGFSALPQGLAAITAGSRSLPFVASQNSLEDVTVNQGGSEVVVTDKGLNTVDTLGVRPGGTLGTVATTPGNSTGAYASVFAEDGQLLVVDAGQSAVSSYVFGPGGSLDATQAPLPDSQSAACWIANGHRNDAFVANAASGSVSSYLVLGDGTLAFVGNTSLPGTGAKPLDDAVSSDGSHLFVVDEANHQVDTFAVGNSGRLALVGETTTASTTPLGIAAS